MEFADRHHDGIAMTEFCPETQLAANAPVLILGSWKTGKTTAALSLLRAKLATNELGSITCFATEPLAERLPQCVTIPGFDRDALDKVIDAQAQKQRELTKTPKAAAIFFDPRGQNWDHGLLNSRQMLYVHLNAVHHNILPITCLVTYTHLNPDVRGNMEVIMLAKPDGSLFPFYANRLRTELFTCFRTDDQLLEALRMLEPFEFLVFDRKAYRKRQPNFLFYYKAPDPEQAFLPVVRLPSCAPAEKVTLAVPPSFAHETELDGWLATLNAEQREKWFAARMATAVGCSLSLPVEEPGKVSGACVAAPPHHVLSVWRS